MTTELMFAFLPNYSLTPLLFALYFKHFRHSVLLIMSYILLQGVIWGFGLYLISMSMGWLIWYFMARNARHLEVKSVLFAVIYGISFMPLTVIVYQVDPIAYLIADIPFQLSMAISNLVTIGFVYPVIDKVIQNMTKGELK